jgi:hypothetical protein
MRRKKSLIIDALSDMVVNGYEIRLLTLETWPSIPGRPMRGRIARRRRSAVRIRPNR